MSTNQHDILQAAREAGMTILLDGRIGRQEYQSVSGSAEALQRFAHAVCVSAPSMNRRVRAASSASVNPLVTARMRERIASGRYGNTPRRNPSRARRARRQFATTNSR